MKQVIIARKDLKMSPGKLAAQVSHGSMAFLTTAIKRNAYRVRGAITVDYRANVCFDENGLYFTNLAFDSSTFEDWINGSFTKIVCEAKNKSQLEKAIKIAEELKLREGVDFFLIRDNCATELRPEDEDGRTLTCIGFRPLPDDVAEKISKRFQLYR